MAARSTPQDTPAQQRALKANPVARKVRARYPVGTLVISKADQVGVVKRHVPAYTSLGGTLTVTWLAPKFGATEGRVTCLDVEPVSDADLARVITASDDPAFLTRLASAVETMRAH